MDINTDLKVAKRHQVGSGRPALFGLGPAEVHGMCYEEGPSIVGDPKQFDLPATDGEDGGPPSGAASLMVGQNSNSYVNRNPLFGGIPFYALFVKTYARIKSFLKVDTMLTVETIKAKVIWSEVVQARSKNFVIPHPSKVDKQLVHACLEGPENGVYYRGRITNDTVITLPPYWKDFIDSSSITVQLQPIGIHQNIIVKRVNNREVHLQANGTPIDCFYHVYGERNDIEKLEVEID